MSEMIRTPAAEPHPGWRLPNTVPSLPEVFGSIPVPRDAGFWRLWFVVGMDSYLLLGVRVYRDEVERVIKCGELLLTPRVREIARVPNRGINELLAV